MNVGRKNAAYACVACEHGSSAVDSVRSSTTMILKTAVNQALYDYAWQYKHCHGKLT
jgi:hypothetical protein